MLTDKSLPDLIQWWLAQKPARNISSLARGSGIHRASLHRYIQGQKAQYKKVEQLVYYMFRQEQQVALSWLERNQNETDLSQNHCIKANSRCNALCRYFLVLLGKIFFKWQSS